MPVAAGAVDWDWEPRCCLVERDLAEGVVVTLTAVGPPVGHLQAITPGGVRIGMDERTRFFYPPQDGEEGGLYALGPLPQRRIDAPGYLDDQPRILIIYPHWTSKRYGRIYRNFMPQPHRQPRDSAQWRLAPGVYRITVIGEFDGRYVLSLDPDGRNGPRPEVRVAGKDGRGVPIRAGEMHVYEFDGGAVFAGAGTDRKSPEIRRLR